VAQDIGNHVGFRANPVGQLVVGTNGRGSR